MKKLRSFLRYYRPHLHLVFLDAGAALGRSGLTVLLPLVIYRIFNTTLPAGAWNELCVLLALLLLLMTLEALAEFIGLRWGHVLGVRMEADMRSDLFRHLQKLSFGYFDRTKTGHLMSRISNDLTQIAESAHHGPEDLLISLTTLAGAFGAMFWINWKLALITLIPLPFVVLWGALHRGKLHRGFLKVRAEVAEINSQVENSIQGIREVKSFTNEDHEMRRFENVNLNFRQAREAVYRTMASFHTGVSFLTHSYSLLFVSAGAVLVYYKSADLPQVITFFMYSRYITMPILRLVSFVEQFMQGLTAFDRFLDVMKESPETEDRPGATPLLSPRGEVVFRDVYFHYPQAEEHDVNWCLRNINLIAPAGKLVALVGESGAGKSTIAALIPRFYEIESGSLTLDGREISTLTRQSLRENIGIVQQSAFLFDGTIGENIRFGRPEATDEEVAAAARAANILDFIAALPEGFDTPVGERGVRLSGGQRQRISIARVFLKNPPILIFDEATSSLDNHSEAQIQQSMLALCRNRTTLLIAHRLSTVRNADLIYALRNGEVVESGTYEELLAKKGYFYELHSLHAR